VPENKRRRDLKHYVPKKGYKWVIMALASGIGFGLLPVILGKSSFYGF
jgi:hypothetical protein